MHKNMILLKCLFFKTMTEPISTYLCPCSSGKNYPICCQPLHEGQPAQNALQLMRSRYAAYALDLPDYIIATTHPASPQYSDNVLPWKQAISKFSQSTSFRHLEVLDFKESSTLATVTFTAHLIQEDMDATFTEKGIFEQWGRLWFYREGLLAQGHAPHLATLGSLKLLPLAYYGNPILTKRAEPVSEITEDILKLVEGMIETMNTCDDIGLAAPQVHHSIRLIVVKAPIEVANNQRKPGKIQVMINPSILEPSEEMCEMSEECLSIPTLRLPIKRPKEITVEYTSLNGTPIKKRCTGWEARVIQHEYDHIEGILFIDRLDKEERDKLIPFLQNLQGRIQCQE